MIALLLAAALAMHAQGPRHVTASITLSATIVDAETLAINTTDIGSGAAGVEVLAVGDGPAVKTRFVVYGAGRVTFAYYAGRVVAGESPGVIVRAWPEAWPTKTQLARLVRGKVKAS